MDAYSQWEHRERQRERWLKRLPRCSECDNHIQDEMCWEYNGELICDRCANDNHRKWVEDYAE